MGPVISNQDAEYTRGEQVHLPSGKRAAYRPLRPAHRRNQVRALVRVPMLDWPSNLFSDEVTLAELMVEDLVLEGANAGVSRELQTAA
jgi:hypothetical protein